jgi:3-methyladenine DNA glycosylase AlkD
METGAKPAKTTAASLARDLRAAMRSGGSAEIAASSQRFFVEKIASHGWRAADLRRFCRSAQRTILADGGPTLLLDVADCLFTGKNTDETIAAVLLLENRARHFGDAEFQRFDHWIDRVTNWAQHDSLVHCLIGPLIAADTKRAAHVLPWTRSRNRWRRRAAAVALIQPARRGLCFAQTKIMTAALLSDSDDMVQKGLGWLLREWAKADPRQTVPFLMTIRATAPRLVLRTACETLPAATRARILATKH